jgi:oxygen-independent coproporphyrinogen III oxidase
VRAWTGPATEFTVEANPGTVTAETAGLLAECGVNRVALGVQSFQAEELRTLGRIHTAEDVAGAIHVLRAAGIENVGLDLIYGIPGQSADSWRRSVESALALSPAHLSAYALSFEEGTPLHGDLQDGRVRAMDESLQKECYHAAIETARLAGLEQYEISNFARDGRQCRHNLTYWHNLPYVGVGPGAAGYAGGIRRTNAPDLDGYCKAVRAGREPPATRERLPGRVTLAETLMLGLRLAEGVERAAVEARFGVDVADAFPESLARHVELGTLEITPSRLRIPTPSLFVSDAVLADIVAEANEKEGHKA